ncbi:MAG: LysE family translocator [Hoeflea sp.]|nr:LysE family translocator [Hoeflea sp.]
MDFVPSLSVLLAFTLASFVLTITPGPDMVLFLGKTLAQGRRAGLMAMLGAFSGSLVHTLLAAFGLSALLMNSATAFGILKLVGALYLLWLAVDAVRNGSVLNLPRARRRPEAASRVYLKGVGVNLTNPKIVLFFVTFLPQFVSAGDPSAPGKLFFLGLYFIAVAFPFCVLMILAADRIAGVARRSPRTVRAIDWLFASVFAGFAVRLLLEPSRG